MTARWGTSSAPFLIHGLGTDSGELSGPEKVSRIGEEGGDLDRAGPDIHLAVCKGKRALVRMNAPISKDQLEHLLSAHPTVLRVPQVLLLAHGDVDFDGIHVGNGCQFLHGSRADQIADLRLGNARRRRRWAR